MGIEFNPPIEDEEKITNQGIEVPQEGPNEGVASDLTSDNYDPIDFAAQQGQAKNDYGLFFSEKDFDWRQDLKNSSVNTAVNMYNMSARLPGFISENTGVPLNLFDDDGTYTHEEYIQDTREWYNAYPYQPQSFMSNVGQFGTQLLPTVATSVGGTGLRAAGYSRAASWLGNSYLGYMSTVSFGAGVTRIEEYEQMMFDTDPNFEGYSALQKGTAGTGYALVTLFAERYALKNWEKAMVGKNSLLMDLGEAYIMGNKTKWSQLMKVIGKDMLTMANVEGGEEAFEQLGQNFVDVALYDRRFAHLFENVLESWGYGFLSGGMLGPTTTAMRLNSHNDLLDIAQQENITIGELARRIMNITSPEEIWVSENFEGGVQHLIDKYQEWKELQPWATNPEAFDQQQVNIDIGTDNLLNDTLGETTIEDVHKQGYFEFINPNDPDNTAGTKVRINFNNMSVDEVKRAMIAMSFIQRKAPRYFETLNTANFTSRWDGSHNVSGDGVFGYFSQGTPGEINVKMEDEYGNPQALERTINTIAHEMMHNRDHKKYSAQKFNDMFKILSGVNEGRYSWEQGIPWSDYRNVKGEDRAFRIGETTGKAFLDFVNNIKRQLIDKAQEDGKKIPEVELEITNDIMKTLDMLWIDYKSKGIPTTQFVNDIVQATGNKHFVESWLQKQLNDNNVIYDSELIKTQIKGLNDKMTPAEVDMAVSLIELWANSTAFKLSQTGREVTADEIISNFVANIKQKKRGVPNFLKDGTAIIKIMKNGTFQDFVSALVPMFTKSLTKGELKIMEEWAGVKDGKWKKKDIDKLANGIIRWLRSGGYNNTADPHTKEIFVQLADQLKDLYRNIRGTKMDVGLTKEMRQAFNNLLGLSTIQDDMKEWKGWYETARHNLRTFANGVFKYFDVESPYKMKGAPKTGFHIKNFFSRINVETEKAQQVTIQIARLLGNDIDKVREFILLYEKPKDFWNHVNKFNKEEAEAWTQAYKVWEGYWIDTLGQLKKFGILKNGFVENQLTKISQAMLQVEEEIKLYEDGDTISDPDNKKIDELKAEWNYLRDLLEDVNTNLNYVHLPILFLLDNLTTGEVMGEVSTKKLRMFMKNRRETLYISDLIDNGFIDVADLSLANIMFNYSRKFAHDIAIGEIMKAAQEEGLAISPDDAMDESNSWVLSRADFIKITQANLKDFRGWHVSPMLNVFLNTFSGVYHQGQLMNSFDTLMASSKLYTFFNPFFLPMYDAMQGAVAVGAANPWNWVKGKWFSKSIPAAMKDGVMDFLTMSDEWMLAEKNGLRSTPFGNPFMDEKEWFEYAQNMNTVYNSKFLGILFKPLRILKEASDAKDGKMGIGTKLAYEMFSSVYQLSFHTAWTLDGMMRQITYRYLRAQGMTPNEAAQMAAQFHGDYAGVPAGTRRILNRGLYTPTFKIAMFKLYGRMLEGAMNVPLDVFNTLRGQSDRQTKIRARYGYSLFTVFALNQVLSMFFKNFGWEEDMYGRRWKKEIANALGEPQVVNVTVSNPFNLTQRFYERFDKAFQPDAEPGSLIRAFKYEFHPLGRAVSEALSGRSSGGDPIWIEGSALDTKMFAALQHIVTECVTMTEGSDMGYSDATVKMRDEFAREAFHNEFPETLNGMLQIMDIMTFKYLTDIKEIKDAERLKRVSAEVKVGIEQLKELYIEQKKAGNDVPFPMHEVNKILYEWSNKLNSVSDIVYKSDPLYGILNGPFNVDIMEKQTHLLYPDMERFVRTTSTNNAVIQDTFYKLNPNGVSRGIEFTPTE